MNMPETMTLESQVQLSKQLLRMVRKRPFQPFRVHLTDGRAFNIRPDMTIVGTTFLSIGIPEGDESCAFAKGFVDVDLTSVREVELLAAPVQTST